MASPAVPPAPTYPEDGTVRSLLALARPVALVLAALAGLLFLITFALFVVRTALGFFSSPLGALYWLASAIVNYLLWRELPAFEALAAQRQYGPLKDRMILWAILGLVFFVVEGVLLLVVYLRLETMPAPSTAPPSGGVSTGAAPAGPTPSAPGPFCTNCGSAATWAPEQGRFYCSRCGTVL